MDALLICNLDRKQNVNSFASRRTYSLWFRNAGVNLDKVNGLMMLLTRSHIRHLILDISFLRVDVGLYHRPSLVSSNVLKQMRVTSLVQMFEK